MRALFKMEPPRWKNPAEFACLMVLANYANHDGVAYPSKPTIARHLGTSARHVWNLTKALEDAGLIVIEQGTGPRGGHRYVLNFEPLSTSKTVEPQFHSESPSTVEPQFHGHNGHSGNRKPGTLEIAPVNSGTVVPGHWNPGSTNPSTTVQRDPKREPHRRDLSFEEISIRQCLSQTAKHLLLVERLPIDSLEDLAQKVLERLNPPPPSLDDFASKNGLTSTAYVGEAVNFAWSMRTYWAKDGGTRLEGLQ